jgi:hypothetical protein
LLPPFLCRADLRDLIDRREAIQALHQRIAQGERNRQRVSAPGIFPSIAGIPQVRGFEGASL